MPVNDNEDEPRNLTPGDAKKIERDDRWMRYYFRSGLALIIIMGVVQLPVTPEITKVLKIMALVTVPVFIYTGYKWYKVILLNRNG